MIRGIHHLALSTRDLDRFVAQYCEWFGFERSGQGGWEVGNDRVDRMLGLKDCAARYEMIRLGNLYVEVFEFSAPQGVSVRPRMCDRGITHFCFYCDDVFAEYERLKALGMTFNCPPGGSAATRATYGQDCDGNTVELLQVVDSACGFGFENLTL